MTKHLLLVSSITAICLLSSAVFNFAQTESEKMYFNVKLEQPANGTISVNPPIPADGKVAAGTILTASVLPATGYALDSGFYTISGPWTPAYCEFFTPEFQVPIGQDRTIGASLIEKKAVEGFTVIQDVVYAQPGIKKLKYDVYSPAGAKNLPCIIIIHGGGWIFNTEDIMRGLARELVRGGKYVVCSIDYRWIGTHDGDKVPNTLADIIGDVYGAIAHIQEHAKSYGADPTHIAVTGDSAGGHLSAAAINLVDQIGDGGFGLKDGIYQFKPTYLPPGKSTAQAREEITLAIKAAAPSYGVFSSTILAKGSRATNQPLAVIKACAPLDHIPNVRQRSAPQLLLRGSLDSLISDTEVRAYADALKAAGQTVEYIQVEGAGHAFFDWKPDAGTKATFVKFGVPYAAKMESFFDTIFYPKH
jgi:acetyl esterase/lipase